MRAAARTGARPGRAGARVVARAWTPTRSTPGYPPLPGHPMEPKAPWAPSPHPPLRAGTRRAPGPWAAGRLGALPGYPAVGRVPRRRLVTTAAVLGVFLVAALVHVWSRLAVVQLGYRLAAAQAAHAHLLEQDRRLRLELATLRAPGHLAAAALDRLGLVPPAPAQIIHLGLSDHPTTAAPGGEVTGKRSPGFAGAERRGAGAMGGASALGHPAEPTGLRGDPGRRSALAPDRAPADKR
jgi:hypothetical protein